jgi:predicted Zn-dependent protease
MGVLEGVLAKQPDHVGAIHLYIHAVEASNYAKRAEPYADRLAKFAPQAGHLVHMPAHIYFRVGRYKDSLATNRVAVKVDETYIQRFHPNGVYPLAYYPHNVHFVMVSAQLSGEGRTVVEAADKLSKVVSSDVARVVLLLQPVKAAPYFAHAQFSDAATVLVARSRRRFSVSARSGAMRGAWRRRRAEISMRRAAKLAEIDRIVATADYKAFDAWKIPARTWGGSPRTC